MHGITLDAAWEPCHYALKNSGADVKIGLGRMEESMPAVDVNDSLNVTGYAFSQALGAGPESGRQ